MKHATNGRPLILISIALFSLVWFLRITAQPWEVPPPFLLVQSPCQEERTHDWRKINHCGKEETWWRHLQTACARGHGSSGWKHHRCIPLTESAVNGEWIYIIRCSNWINLWFLTGSQVWPKGFWEAVGCWLSGLQPVTSPLMKLRSLNFNVCLITCIPVFTSLTGMP